MKSSPFVLRAAGFAAGWWLLSAPSFGAASEADALPRFETNYIKLSTGGADITGSKAAYQARSRNAKTGAAGIEDLRFDYDLKDRTTLQIDGRALAGQEDYLLAFKVTKEEVGTFEMGYKTFRTFYDGAGGFFPIGNAWLPLFSRPLHVDRGQFFVRGSIARPKAPVISFKYTNSTRDGRKDSTTWGDSNLTGIPILVGPGAVNPIAAQRKLLPTYVDLDERHDAWEISVRHKLGNTTATVAVGGSGFDNRNVRELQQNIGELTPFPAPTYTVATRANERAGSPRRTTMTQTQDERGYHASATFETALSSKLTLFGALQYHQADIDLTLSRDLRATIASASGVREYAGGFVNTSATARAPYHFVSKGDLKYEVITGNLGARFQPSPKLVVETALRGERWEDSGRNAADYSSQGVTLATGAVTAYAAHGDHGVKNVERPWTPTLDLRYTVSKHLSLYANWEYRTSKQDERVRYEGLNGQTKRTELDLIGKDIAERHSNAKVGLSWALHPALNLRAELFTKDHENEFVGLDDIVGRDYALNYDLYGTKLTAVAKATSALSFTSRYVLQRGKTALFHGGLRTTGVINGTVDGRDSARHTLSESVSWSVSKALFVQANGSVVYDQIQTMYPWVSGNAKRNLRNADSNYVTGDALVGFAIDRRTSGTIQATYYRANNYDEAYAAVAMPLGASARESTISVGLQYKLNAKTVLGGKLGYVDSENATRGGYADFRGPLAYLSVQHAF